MPNGLPKRKSAAGLPPNDAKGDGCRGGKVSALGAARKSLTSLDLAREAIVQRRIAVVPIPDRKKKPVIVGWQNLRITAETASEYFNGRKQNLGAILGDPSQGLADVDLDHPLAIDLADHFLPPTPSVFGRPGKPRSHRLYRTELGVPHSPFKTGKKDDGSIVELRANGCQTVLPGSTHPTGEAIEWDHDGDPATIAGKDLLRAVERLAAATLLALHWPDTGIRNDVALALAGALLTSGWSDEEAEHFIGIVAEAGGSQDVAAKVRTVVGTRQKLEAGEGITGLKQLRELMGAEVIKPITKWIHLVASPVTRITPDAAQATDLGNARRLVAEHGADLIYVPGLGWFYWDGRCFRPDDTGEVFRRAKATVGRLLVEVPDIADHDLRKRLGRHALDSHSAPRLKAMVELAKSELEIVASVGELDTDPMAFNVDNGTLDLGTGELRPSDRADRLTHSAPVTFKPEAKCPRWEEFLNRIQNGNRDTISFLQRAVGYAMTGLTREQVLFLLYGTGSNGKSTFLRVIGTLMGGYAAAMAFTSLTTRARSAQGPSEDIARLRGARFVTAIETGEGQTFNEALVKQVTGGDVLNARFLHQNSFDFLPQFKLFLAANHKPTVLGTDHAIWRRFRLVPFTVQIPDAEQQRDLVDRLLEELPGILNWALAGVAAWRQEGLGIAEAVSSATQQYRQESDSVGAFITARCETGEYRQDGGELFNGYRDWCGENDRQAESPMGFGSRLTALGYVKQRQGHGKRGYDRLGLRLREEDM